MSRLLAPVLAIVAACSLTACRLSAAEIDFSHDVAPILRQHCGKCHAGEQQKGGFSFNTRQSLLAGGESGKAVVVGKSAESSLLSRITSDDDDLKMPPEGPRVPAAQVAILRQWIETGLAWQDGFTFGKRNYEPPLKPRRPEAPPIVDGRANLVDRFIDAHLAQRKAPRPQPIDDATFARRVYLDVIGLLPPTDELHEFLADESPDKRSRLVRRLLDRDLDYAEHWLTFWNDLLRNDYAGTGFITKGRTQISAWLYRALVTNMPYDQFARELIAPPTKESAGFSNGIRWRGDVSAGQTVEIQFAQSVGQTFLGINLKCASCHDSFIDRWKLDESYGLAAIYSDRPLEIHRCDKPTGKMAQAGWLFPEIGQVDAKAPQRERLSQLAALLTHPENGRFTRTIVNRLWHRLMGRGIVHPTDAMQTEPWNADLLDGLAAQLADNGYDLKQTIELIATSEAYQSHTQVLAADTDEHGYTYAGPRAKRMTAEQFMDAVWSLTGSAPNHYDAPVVRGAAGALDAAAPGAAAHSDKTAARGKRAPRGKRAAARAQPVAPVTLTAKWIWSRAGAPQTAADETLVFRKQLSLAAAPPRAVGVVSCDDSYTLFVNGQRVRAGDNWEEPDAVQFGDRLKTGPNDIVIVAKNGGDDSAGLFFEARLIAADGKLETVASDDSWQWTTTQLANNGKFAKEPDDWQSAVLVADAEPRTKRLNANLAAMLGGATQSAGLMVRASLLKSDFLMRSLGRPNRDQIVSVRPTDVSTLEAIDLSNGQALAHAIEQGAKKLSARSWSSSAEFVRWLYESALCREPSPDELAVLVEEVGPKPTPQSVEDALWSVFMLPEFQFVR